MKKVICSLSLAISLTIAFVAQAAEVWVSDEIEAPLRDKPELNAKIVAMLPAGQRLTAIDQNDDYVKIKTAKGVEGWLSNYYVLRSISIHEQLAPIKKSLSEAEATVKTLSATVAEQKQQIKNLKTRQAELEKSAGVVAEQAKSSAGSAQKLTDENALLQQKLSEQSEKMAELAKALDSANQKATTARTRYVSLVKVSENAVEIDTQNRNLQEKVVQFEQQIQQLKNENQSLNAELDGRQTAIAAILIFGGLAAGYILSIMTPRGRRPSSGSFPSF